MVKAKQSLNGMDFKNIWLTVIVGWLVAGCAAAAPAAEKKPAPTEVSALRDRALQILRSALRDKDPQLRAWAVEVVAQTGQKQLSGELVRLMNDPTVAVRFAALVASGDMRCVGCQKELERHLDDDDPNIQLAAAYALYQLGDTARADKLRAGLSLTDATARANAALLVGKAGLTDQLSVLYGLLKDPQAGDKVMIQAVESIARLKDTRIYRSKLWALLISKYADDRVMGIRGMAELGTVEAKQAIATMLTDDVPEIRLFAAEQLARLGDFSGIKEVQAFFDNSPSFNEGDFGTLTAVMAIGRFNHPSLNGYLPKALASANARVRLTAAQSVLWIVSDKK